MIAFETFQTVPLVAQRDMDPFMQIQNQDKAFPIPGEDFTFVRLDLSRSLIRHPEHTFFIQVSEEALEGVGILPGDIVLVDREAEPRHGSLILAFVEGEFLLRRLHVKEDLVLLFAEHPDHPVIEVEPDLHFSIWGVIKDHLKV